MNRPSLGTCRSVSVTPVSSVGQARIASCIITVEPVMAKLKFAGAPVTLIPM